VERAMRANSDREREEGRKGKAKAMRGGNGGVESAVGRPGNGSGESVVGELREIGGPGRDELRVAGRGVPNDASVDSTEPRPDPEVVAQAKRRTFSAKYKLRILEKADGCTEAGQLGALLRREGLYSSNLKTWRRQREEGSLKGLAPKKRGPRPDPDKELLQRIAKLEKENLRLADKLEKAELIIEVQKKVARLLGAEQPEDREGRK